MYPSTIPVTGDDTMKLCVALLLSWGLVSHGGAFPLPLKHSVVARAATDLSTEMGEFCRPGDEMIIARFNEGGYHWKLFYTATTGIGMFVQYDPDNLVTPLRAWIYKDDGESDNILITRDVESPATAWPNGPCRILYPESI